MENNIEILYIDDEDNNLIGFKANFRMKYLIHTASNTQNAEKILNEHPNIRVILCDQRMPEEFGIDFLNRVKKEFPRPIRILLTAYADMETVIDAINKGNIFRFVRKPWTEEDIISAIEEANKFYITSSLLDVRNEELEKAYNELDKFAYSVSHDLRDPLVGVQSAINLALTFKDLNQIHELLHLMGESITKLDAYIDSLKDYYLLRRGELTLSEIDFESLFKDIQQFYKISTRNNNVKFTTFTDQSTPFIGDKSILELILHNLLSNAFKYQRLDNSEKTVSLSVTVLSHQAYIVIRDTGIGIPSDSVGDIFKLFFRASNQAKGMGFGLYNVKTALSKIQGTISVNSKVGEGTSFIITIPNKQNK